MNTSPRPLFAMAVALLTSLAGCGSDRFEPMASATLQHGPFEIVAKGRRISSGSFPNNSSNPFSTMEVTSFSVRWHGQDVVVPQLGSHFWRVLRLLDAPQPALLVSTTDFHLITEVRGQLVVTSFAPPSTDIAELQWLDSDNGQPGKVQMFGIEKVVADKGTEWRGGRWLRVSHHSVLDVQTLAIHPVRPWVPGRAGDGVAGLNAGNIRARLFSPGRTQFVAPASDYDHQKGTGRYDGLVVVDIASGEAYGHKIDHQRMRYADQDDISAAWINHYFQWQRDAQGREHLQPRVHPKPWPWQGRFIEFGDHVEYRVMPVKDAMLAEVRRFAVEELGARVAPDWTNPKRSTGDTFTLPGCDGSLAIVRHDNHVGIFVPTAKEPPWVRCQDTVRRFGDAFNTELAGGRLDTLFITD